jgi:protein TonB
VRFRNDILRGLRIGTILLALFIAGVVTYRIAPEFRAAALTREETPKPAAPRGPDPRFLAGSPVPPPPPTVGGKKTARRPAPIAAAPVEVADTPFENPPASESVIREAPIEAVPPPTPVQETIVESPAPVVPVAKPEARPKRWARAVGRFLHIVHPPQN